MAGRMSKALALRFCDFVSGPGMPGWSEFDAWAASEGFDDAARSAFWCDLALWVRDCEHKHAAFVMYRLAYVLASRLREEQRFIARVGDVFSACAERFGVHEYDIRKEEEQCAPTEG